MALIPIWRDYFQNLSPAASSPAYIDFKIQLTDTSEIIYTGRAFRINNGVVTIRINDIIADWLANVLPYGSYASITHPVKFDVYAYVNNAWVKKNTTPLQFINDWSYDSHYDVGDDGLCFPINGRVRNDQPLVYTGNEGTTVEVELTTPGGVVSSVDEPFEIDADVPIGNTSDLYHEFNSAGVGTLVKIFDNVARVEFEYGAVFNIIDSCAKYALYYVNAYGGWDTFLVEGNIQEYDTISRFTKEQSYSNTNVEDRWKSNFANELTKSFVMHTGWLTDEQSSRMHHLLESTNVYLYDFSKLEFQPILITNSTCEYKTSKSIGNRLVDYEITCDLAKYRVRR